MSVLQAILLGIVQGITEFLPVSSFGHLAAIENAMGHYQGYGSACLRCFFMWEPLSAMFFRHFDEDIRRIRRGTFGNGYGS